MVYGCPHARSERIEKRLNSASTAKGGKLAKLTYTSTDPRSISSLRVEAARGAAANGSPRGLQTPCPEYLFHSKLVGSGWVRKPGEGSNSESSEPEEIILREPDWDSVPLFKRPTSPEILKEFAHMFGSSWVLLGTPEAGFGVLAMMEMQLPVIALARNEAHTRALEAIVDERLANAILDEQSVFTNPALTKLWIDVGGAKSSKKRKTRRKVNTPEKAHRMDGKQEKGRKASSVKNKEPEHSESEGEEDEEEDCLGDPRCQSQR